MSKAKTGLLDRIVAATHESKTGPKTWFDRLPGDHQAALMEAKAAWRAGECGKSKRAFIFRLIQGCREEGIAVSGFEGVKSWLDRD